MTLFKPIELPYTHDSVIRVLNYGACPEINPYSHKQIAEWCDRFWCQYLKVDPEPAIEKLLPVLTDIETQWELYLANIYSVDELRSESFENEKMPTQWFQEWLKDIET